MSVSATAVTHFAHTPMMQEGVSTVKINEGRPDLYCDLHPESGRKTTPLGTSGAAVQVRSRRMARCCLANRPGKSLRRNQALPRASM